MFTIKNGEEKSFSFSLTNVDTADLGTPTVVVSQKGNTYPLEITAMTSTTVVAKITSDISKALTPDLVTNLQLSWNDGYDGILVYPSIQIAVEEAYVPITGEDIAVDDEEPTPDIEYDEEDYSEDGYPDEEYEDDTEQEPVEDEDINDDSFVEYDDTDGGIEPFDESIDDEEV